MGQIDSLSMTSLQNAEKFFKSLDINRLPKVFFLGGELKAEG
jgi:hypothetical protein